MALHCEAASAAYIVALIAMPPFPLVLTNRITYYALLALEIATLGLLSIIIVPILILLELQYLIWTIQAALTMSIYQLAGEVLVWTAPNFKCPPQITCFPVDLLLAFGFTVSGTEALAAAAAARAENLHPISPFNDVIQEITLLLTCQNYLGWIIYLLHYPPINYSYQYHSTSTDCP